VRSGLVCEECQKPFEDLWHRRRPRYCGSKCRYKARDRRRYQADPEGERAKSRAYYVANREHVIQRVKAYQQVSRTLDTREGAGGRS